MLDSFLIWQRCIYVAIYFESEFNVVATYPDFAHFYRTNLQCHFLRYINTSRNVMNNYFFFDGLIWIDQRRICKITAWHRPYLNSLTLLRRHNDRDGVSNHQPHDCLLNRLFRRRSKKISKLSVTDLCEENSPESGELSAQMDSNAENVSIWWRHHGGNIIHVDCDARWSNIKHTSYNVPVYLCGITVIMSWTSNYMQHFICGIITPPYHDFNGRALHPTG